MSVALSDIVEISSEVLCQDVSDEMVILDLKSGCYFALDVTGARIWKLIQEHRKISDVYRQMLQEFDVEEDTLANDLHQHLAQLLAAGLITRSSPQAQRARSGQDPCSL